MRSEPANCQTSSSTLATSRIPNSLIIKPAQEVTHIIKFYRHEAGSTEACEVSYAK